MPALRLLIPRALSIASSSRALPLQSPRQFRPLHTGRRYSYNMAQHGHSAACCSIPPIVSKGYEAKGKYETIGGMKTCEPLSSYHRYLPQLPWLTTPFKMSLALPMPPRPSSMSSTSSDTSHSQFRAPIFYLHPTRTTNIRSSCPISLMANPLISPGAFCISNNHREYAMLIVLGTHPTTTRKERHSATSSKPLEHLLRPLRRSQR